MKKFALFLAALLLTACQTATDAFAGGSTFVADQGRTVYIRGEIGGEIMDSAVEVNKMANADKSPITLVINSPGGSVEAGIQFISAMQLAQAQGVRFRCFTPVMAASMAYQIFGACDERYTFRYSLLLWHPVKEMLRQPQSSDDLLYAGKSIRALERPLIEFLIRKMKIDRKTFFYHYRHETLWTAESLKELVPNFFTIVDNIEGVKNPFDLH